jgi:hypothetical protein
LLMLYHSHAPVLPRSLLVWVLYFTLIFSLLEEFLATCGCIILKFFCYASLMRYIQNFGVTPMRRIF